MDLQYVFVVIATVLASLHIVQTEEMSAFHNKKVYCGKQLSQTLSTVCRGNYNTLNKKADIFQVAPRFTGDSQRGLKYPFRSKTSASSLMSNFRRRKRGVFNECCEKACAQEELAAYCGFRK